jgi:hypothetical protein
MAEKTILVCDACGRPAAETVTIRLARGNFVKDLCSTHVNELIGGARRPRRGRPRGSGAPTTATGARGRRKRSTSVKSSAAKRSTAKRSSGAKRASAKRGARRRSAAAS